MTLAAVPQDRLWAPSPVAVNCAFIRHIDDLAVDLVALRPIEAGEEPTIDYQMTLWFTPE